MTSETAFHPPHAKKKPAVIKIVLAVFIVGLAATTTILGYLYFNTHTKLTQLSTPEGQQKLAEEEVALTLSRLQKLTIIPEEEPVVATIIDASLLASQSAFYRDAQNGDQLVVFPQAQKAYIFSPHRNLIVNAGPLIINSDQSSDAPSDSDTTTTPLSVEVRNGSSTPGKATQISQQLDTALYQVSSVTPAQNTEYSHTIIINLTNQATAQQLEALQTQLQASSGSLPAGEANSNADLLIIVGNS